MRKINYIQDIGSVKKKLCFLTICLFLLTMNSKGLSQLIYPQIPDSIDTSKKYVFYLHGRIIEEQGIRPTSKQFGIYEYEEILHAFADQGFVVISEAREKNTQPEMYAKKIASQIDTLLKDGVPPSGITVIGASKGAAIAVLVSSILKNEYLHFILMAICNNSMAAYWLENNVQLWGKVLYFYDNSDAIAGSCKESLPQLASDGLQTYQEIELDLGLGHGFLYRPLENWVLPAIEWVNQ